MYKVRVKRKNETEYRTIKTFAEYKKAYYWLGDYFQRNDTLHWTLSLRFMKDGYKKEHLYKVGTTYIRRGSTHFKIQNLDLKIKSNNN
jgi:hypothetical protein